VSACTGGGKTPREKMAHLNGVLSVPDDKPALILATPESIANFYHIDKILKSSRKKDA
jgi:hypothetical protein